MTGPFTIDLAGAQTNKQTTERASERARQGTGGLTNKRLAGRPRGAFWLAGWLARCRRKSPHGGATSVRVRYCFAAGPRLIIHGVRLGPASPNGRRPARWISDRPTRRVEPRGRLRAPNQITSTACRRMTHSVSMIDGRPQRTQLASSTAPLLFICWPLIQLWSSIQDRIAPFRAAMAERALHNGLESGRRARQSSGSLSGACRRCCRPEIRMVRRRL